MKYRFYYLLLITTILSHFILYAPYQLNKNLFNGSFVAIFIALIIACINAYMVIYVYNHYRNYNIIAINRVLLGKFLGGLFSFLYIIAYLAVSFFMFRGLLEIIVRFMLPSTPIWFLAISLLFIPYINLLNNNQSFLRFIGFIAMFIIFWSILQFLLSLKGFHLYYAKIAVIHSIKLPNLKTIASAGFFFSGVSHLALFNPEFKKINWKKTCLLYITLGTTVALLAIYIPAGILGPYGLNKVLLTAVSTSDTLSIDLFFIERALYILLPLFFLLGASDYLIFGYVAWGLIKTIIPNKKVNMPIINILGVLYVVLATLIKNTETLLEYGSFAITIALLYHNILSLVLFILTKLKEGKTV